MMIFDGLEENTQHLMTHMEQEWCATNLASVNLDLDYVFAVAQVLNMYLKK
jgi:hypothetical protein